MTDDENQQLGADQEDGNWSGRFGRRISPRSRSAYVVLAVGVVALLALLLIIYFSTNRSQPEQPICTTVSNESARQAVLEGRISKVTIAYDDEITPPSARDWGPVLARLNYTDGQCANLPQGIANQDDMYLLIGTITTYNDITGNAQIEINYDRETALSAALFATPTPIPTETPVPTPTTVPTATATPSPGVSATPSPTPTKEVIGPVLQPDASPAATPDATPGVSGGTSPLSAQARRR